jgi:hypothetical protein
MNMRMNRSWVGVTALAMALSLHGCGGDEDTTALVTQIPVNTPAAIAQESAPDYDDNVNGLISAATLKRWKDNWLNERPAGITGKLVILQVSGRAQYSGATTLSRLILHTSSPTVNVFTYLSPSSEWIQTRSNGVIETPSMVPDGTTMDALLKKYNIDPQNDMIVAPWVPAARATPWRRGASGTPALLGGRQEEPGDSQRRQLQWLKRRLSRLDLPADFKADFYCDRKHGA